MRKRIAKVSFKMPSWAYCNHQSVIKGPSNLCRFCVKFKKVYVCVLDNLPLMTDGELIMKHETCLKASRGEEITDAIQLDGKTTARIIIDEYRKTYDMLVDEGYSHVIADKLAREVVLGHDSKKL